MKKTITILLTALFFFVACQNKNKEEAISSVKEWMGKEILFPQNSIFTIRGKDTIDFNLNKSEYKIVSYIDTAGCTSCRLKLAEWQRFMNEVNSITSSHTPFVFYLYPKNTKDLLIEFRREAFDYPVCLDETDEFNRLNQLAKSNTLRTFLLDKENKIVAIGNPIENPNIKKFYLKTLTGKETESSQPFTQVDISTKEMDFGTFSKDEEQKDEILFRNIGDKPFVIYDIVTSCGCTKVEYPNKPAMPGETLKVSVTYKDDQSGHIFKNLKIYSNIQESPLRIRIKGIAQ